MTPLARSWLRRIALGLPIAAAPFAAVGTLGLFGCGPCDDLVERFPIDEPEAARVLAEGLPACLPLCREGKGGVLDAGTPTGDSPDLYSAVGDAKSCSLVAEGDMLMLECTWMQDCPSGRLPSGLAPPRAALRGAGAWFAQVAWLEAASVPAFEELARDLELHAAPVELVRAARRSANDERRHARVVGALARARGAVPRAPARGPVTPRSLDELARENAAEGCAREAFGALHVAWQGAHAVDRDVRAAMREVARDEARHAELSFAIDAWARPRVRDAAALDDARDRALHELRRSDRLAPADARALGVPTAPVRRAMLRALAA